MENVETNVNLTEYEIQVLVITMSKQNESGVHRSTIDTDMSKANFTPLATSIAITGLKQKEMIGVSIYTDEADHIEYEGWKLTTKGIDWIMTNQKDLPLKKIKDDQGSPF